MLIKYRVHALKRMAARNIPAAAVESVIANGTTIENYPTAKPLSARLILGSVGGRVLHVVVGEDVVGQTIQVVTVYEPDLTHWEPDFKTRRKP